MLATAWGYQQGAAWRFCLTHCHLFSTYSPIMLQYVKIDIIAFYSNTKLWFYNYVKSNFLFLEFSSVFTTLFFLLLFNYSCLHFLPTLLPHSSHYSYYQLHLNVRSVSAIKYHATLLSLLFLNFIFIPVSWSFGNDWNTYALKTFQGLTDMRLIQY